MNSLKALDLGWKLADLWRDQSEWSQATFGNDGSRGPLGPLKHLEREAREAQEMPYDPSEYADCLLLTIDAARRAGLSLEQLLDAAVAKLAVNKSRTWPTLMSDLVICAWGHHGSLRNRDNIVLEMLIDVLGDRPIYHLGLTAGGQPKHPLYLRGDTVPQEWR